MARTASVGGEANLVTCRDDLVRDSGNLRGVFPNVRTNQLTPDHRQH